MENFRRAEEGSRGGGGGGVINDRPAGRIIFSGRGHERGRVWRDGFLEGERKKKDYKSFRSVEKAADATQGKEQKVQGLLEICQPTVQIFARDRFAARARRKSKE